MTSKTSAKQELPLKEQAYLHIKSLVLTEEIPVNSFLSERSLAEQLGMSKTPVRLAIERLEHEGFVRVSPQQGIVVVALSFEEILDFIEYRLALECFVVERIAGNLLEPQIKALQNQLKEQAQIIGQKSSKREDLVLADMAFHRLLAEFKGNKQISQALERQQDMLFRVANRIYQKHPTRTETSHNEHEAIAQAIIEGKKDEATRLIKEHIQKIKSLLIGSNA
ncbi:MAG: GntR family transcriptional regulator [Trueperaceae bacterium]|nr:GntR family transcriptional regulator [Trueperaceae bacterium]